MLGNFIRKKCTCRYYGRRDLKMTIFLFNFQNPKSMAKRFTLFLSSLAMMASAAFAGGNYTYDIIGTTYKVDTLFHAKVGPGTTQTSLLFTGPTYNLRAFYLTIDITDPHVSIRAVSGNDKVAGGERTSSMAQRH